MTKVSIVLLFLTMFLSCREQHAGKDEKQIIFVVQKNINDTLDYYFEKYEIEPDIIINNVEGNQKEVSLLKHKIKWFDEENETKVQIDNDLFSLKKAVTLNNVQGESVDSVDFANNWDQIKYFKFNNEELVGIRMSFYPCTGLGCSVDYFLFYDFHHKTKNYFGIFRSDRELKLYHFNNNDQIDYLSKTYRGETDGVAQKIEHVYELFSLSDKGKFVIQKDSQGKPYFINHSLPIEDTSSAEETLQMQWFEKIK